MRIFQHSRLLFLYWLPVLLLLAACSAPVEQSPSTVTPQAPAVDTPTPLPTATGVPAGTFTPAPSAGTFTPAPSAGNLTPAPSALTPSPAAAGSFTPAPSAATLTPPPSAVTFTPALSSTPALFSASPSPTPAAWKSLPVIPGLSVRARNVYQLGVVKGNDPHAFAKIGDCETDTDWFLEDFDKGPGSYSLGPYQSLQSVIDYFKGSFGRKSLAARRGFNAASLLTTFWSDPEQCKTDETPLACEYRIQRPSLALIMLGTNDVSRKDAFEQNLRQVIQFSLDQSVLPVLVTKADNLEGDESINATIARLAQEYDLPLWNFWAEVQPLPGHGLVEDGAHLTHAPNRFDDPLAMKAAWPWRNLSTLQVLDAVLQGVK